MNNPVGFTPKGARRVAAAARSEERFDRLLYNRHRAAGFPVLPRQRVGWPVRVTGQPSGGTPDLWPAVVLEFAGYLDGVPTWEDGEACWAVPLPGGADLATNAEALGEPVGEHEDKVIFATAVATPSDGFGSAVNVSGPIGLTASSGTWATLFGFPILSITALGRYVIVLNCRWKLQNSAASSMGVRLASGGSALANTARLLGTAAAGVSNEGHTTNTWMLDLAPQAIEFEFRRVGSGSWTTSQIESDTSGFSEVEIFLVQ